MASVTVKRKYIETVDLTTNEPTAKRLNLQPGGTPTSFLTPRPLIEEKLKALTPAEISTLLTNAAVVLPAVASMLNEVFKAKVEAQSTKVITFDYEVQGVWRMLQPDARGSSSKRLEAAGTVANDITETMKDIARRSLPRAITSAATRWNAMEALRRIGKTIVLSTSDPLPHEIYKHFGSDSTLVDSMTQIVESMSHPERKEIYMDWRNDRGELFGDRLLELEKLGRAAYMFDGLDKVVRLLSEAQSDDDDDSGDGEDEDDSEGSEDGDAEEDDDEI